MELFDLDRQYSAIKKEFSKKINSILENSDFILGQEVRAFEEEFSKFCHTKYAVGLNSGTDALFLSLKCLGIGLGHEVIVPSFSFIATSFAVSYTGAKPVFVDIDLDTYSIDTKLIEKAVTKNTKAIIPVHLFGLCANMPQILKIAQKHKLYVIEDSAQAHGAKIKNQFSGSIGHFGCFSFYPTKNLGAAGDAGMITTNSKTHYRKLLQLRDCGRDKKRYEHIIVGYNSRLDNIQAAFLRLKLAKLAKWTAKRIINANTYNRLLKDIEGTVTPFTPKGFKHVYHVYSIRTNKRSRLIGEFERNKIPFSIFYRLPLHLQKSNRYLKYKIGDFPVAEKVSKEILSLPIHPNFKKKDILKIVSIIRKVHYGKN
ncbi:MAG: DegT/DnrJ/EryC1/StrS family aminotransferase [Candidatus Omnitrophica bacterium]|nr:DegT/DnrJ/EryC1/StrS family aminotransferase [Candidatus Omnitrophota bacterium]